MSAVTPFDFKGQQVRTVRDEQGEPLFVAADIAKILGYSESSAMTRTLDEDERHTLHSPQGIESKNPNIVAITEAGLYSAILRSRVPAAREFKRWVTHEVLPSIRRHGMYATEQTVETMLSDPDTAIRLLETIKEERAARLELEAQRKADAPKVLFADAVSTSDSTILVGDLAKILRGNGIDIGATRLFVILRDRGYLISRRGSDWNSPTQRAMDLGLFKIKETAVTHSDGHVTVNRTPKVTGKGQTYFVERFLSGRLEPAA